MKIKSLILENNLLFGNIIFDFTDENGCAVDTIILAGENGCGKTAILEIIYEFSKLDVSPPISQEKRTFEVELTEDEIGIFLSFPNLPEIYKQLTNHLFIKFDYSKRMNYTERISITYKKLNEVKEIPSSYFFELKSMFKSIYSNVQVNFFPRQTKNATSEEIDASIEASIKMSDDIATKIKQTIIDLDTADAREMNNWARENAGQMMPIELQQRRMKRFTNAFSQMFNNLNFSRVSSINEELEVLFKNYTYEVPISSLSSGEKQIVFRAGEILKKALHQNVRLTINKPINGY